MSSSSTLARVQTLQQKADELADKGHIPRAAEIYGRAAEAARSLGADNLVALHLQLRQCSMLCVAYAAVAPLDASSSYLRTCAAYRAEAIMLLSGAVEALERRRAAGTLLDGKCSAAEEAWNAGVLQRRHRHSPAEAASLAAFVGYEEFLRAAKSALFVIAFARAFALECSNFQFQSLAGHAVRAAELMQQPRRHGDTTFGIEADFTVSFRKAAAKAASSGLDAHLVQRLADAWQRVQRSGVLQARGIEECIRFNEPEGVELMTAVQNSMTAPGLRSCALPGCGAKEAHPAHFKSCAACRTVVYCCREHQVVDWPAHKKKCKVARKAAAAEDEAGPSGA